MNGWPNALFARSINLIADHAGMRVNSASCLPARDDGWLAGSCLDALEQFDAGAVVGCCGVLRRVTETFLWSITWM